MILPPPKAPTWTLKQMNIREFWAMRLSIDCNPVTQRPDVSPNPIGASEPSKQQSIIDCILRGRDIGEIRICEEPEGRYEYESIDGGNRKRTIIGFLNGDFPTHKSSIVGEKYVNELTKEEREWLLNYPMRFVIYGPLTNQQKGEIFREVNNITEVNFQETLNSYGDMPIANLIREAVRIIPQTATTPHALFEESGRSKKKALINLDFNNDRLAIEETVSRITYMIYKGEKAIVSPNKKLVEMYEDANLDQKEVNKIGKKLKECLDFILKCSQSYKSVVNKGITKGRYVMLYRLFFYFKETNGDFRVNDYDAFAREFDRVFQLFNPRNPKRLKIDVYDDTRTIVEAFNQHLGEHNTQFKFDNTIKWMLEYMDLTEATVIGLDKNRTFNRKDIELKLMEQDYTCWVSGEPLTMKDAQGGHIIPHSKGGKTDYSNLVVISAEHNRRMQDMNAHEYKKQFLESLEAA